jgi:hypothetical protein
VDQYLWSDIDRHIRSHLWLMLRQDSAPLECLDGGRRTMIARVLRMLGAAMLIVAVTVTRLPLGAAARRPLNHARHVKVPR